MKSIAKQWAKIATKMADTGPKPRLSYYLRRIRELVEGGFKLATPAHAALFEKLAFEVPEGPDSKYTYCPWSDFRPNTTSIQKTEPKYGGLFSYSTHDRSERIEEAVESLLEVHKKAIKKGQAWLMPVYDDKEYIGWDFDIVEGTEDEVTAKLEKIVAEVVPLLMAKAAE